MDDIRSIHRKSTLRRDSLSIDARSSASGAPLQKRWPPIHPKPPWKPTSGGDFQSKAFPTLPIGARTPTPRITPTMAEIAAATSLQHQAQSEAVRDTTAEANLAGSGFWLEQPLALFSSLDCLPRGEMNNAERLNALTRMIIIIAAIMFVVKFPGWLTFLVIGMTTTIILWYILSSRGMGPTVHHREFIRRPRILESIPTPPPPNFTIHNQPLELLAQGRYGSIFEKNKTIKDFHPKN